MKPISVNGWKIYFHPLFGQQYQQLRSIVTKLRENFSDDEYVIHTDVKLFAAIVKIIYEVIPSDPFAHYLVLTGNLKKYSRVKKKGLSDRYRLFFKIFKDKKSIVILWLGHPRKEGDKNDCYTKFSKMVARNHFPDNFENLIAEVTEFQETSLEN